MPSECMQAQKQTLLRDAPASRSGFDPAAQSHKTQVRQVQLSPGTGSEMQQCGSTLRAYTGQTLPWWLFLCPLAEVVAAAVAHQSLETAAFSLAPPVLPSPCQGAGGAGSLSDSSNPYPKRTSQSAH